MKLKIKFTDLPVGKKFILINLVLTISSLIISSLMMYHFQSQQIKQNISDQLKILAKTTAENSQAPILFLDSRSAAKILQTLHIAEDIQHAIIYTVEFKIFAKYTRDKNINRPIYAHKTSALVANIQFKKNHIEAYFPIARHSRPIGTLYLQSDISAYKSKRNQLILELLLIFLLIIIISILLSSHLHHYLSSPIINLAMTARVVAHNRDYTIRAPRYGKDEVGLLIDDFNAMLDRIQHRDTQLLNNQEELEAEVAQRTLELKIALTQAVEISRLKSAFLANMSHEIRTPMNGIVGTLSLLQNTSSKSKQRRFIKMANRSAENLLSLINDILDLSKIEAGHLKINNIDYDLWLEIQNIADEFSQQASQKPIDIACLINPNVPHIIHADNLRIRQIITNLMANAIKFTPKGMILLSVQYRQNTTNKTLLFSVEDTGIGIKKEIQNKIFESFRQADGSITRKYGGTGLGLSISRQLVHLMHGKIGVTSNENKGSKFSVTLPIVVPEQEKASQIDTQNHDIYLYSNNQLTNLCFKNIMLPNHTPPPFTNKEKILAFIKQHPPEKKSILLIDSQHIKDDLAEITLLREQGNLKEHLKIICCNVITENNLLCQTSDAILLKPLCHARLHKSINNLFNKTEQARAKPVEKNHIKALNYDKKILLVEDDEINQMVTIGMLEALGYRHEIAENGQIALERLKAHNFHLILMDCQMPIMDGYTATQKIRQMERHHKTKKPLIIIALTANVMQDDKDKCNAAGMNDFISKPIDLESMKTTLQQWI